MSDNQNSLNKKRIIVNCHSIYIILKIDLNFILFKSISNKIVILKIEDELKKYKRKY